MVARPDEPLRDDISPGDHLFDCLAQPVGIESGRQPPGRVDDLVLFGDAGVAWTSENFDDWTLRTSVPESQGVASGLVTAQPITSAGLSARVNLLGAIVFEMFYARTFQRDKPWDFGLILRPGW